jgi:hypothetical protein
VQRTVGNVGVGLDGVEVRVRDVVGVGLGVDDGPPVGEIVGEHVGVGVGGSVPSEASAASQSTRGKLSPFFASVRWVGEVSSAVSSWSGVRPGCASSRAAPHAAAIGDDCEVPRNVEVPPVIPVDVMGAPGATTSVDALLLLKHVT